MDRTGVVRRIAGVVGGVVVVIGAMSCNGDPTGPRNLEWTDGAAAAPVAPAAPVVAQTLRAGGGPPASGSGVRRALK